MCVRLKREGGTGVCEAEGSGRDQGGVCEAQGRGRDQVCVRLRGLGRDPGSWEREGTRCGCEAQGRGSGPVVCVRLKGGGGGGGDQV